MDRATFAEMCRKTRDHVYNGPAMYADLSPAAIVAFIKNEAQLYWQWEARQGHIDTTPEIEVWESRTDYILSISCRSEGLQMCFGLEKTIPLIKAAERG